MKEETIKHMVNRFLGWKLPDDFSPDAGISFKKEFNEQTEFPMKHEPVGTNLFTATQAEAMVRYMIEGISPNESSISTLQSFIEAEIAKWERVKLDMDTVVCDCGEPYKDSDPANLIDDQILHLKQLLETLIK